MHYLCSNECSIVGYLLDLEWYFQTPSLRSTLLQLRPLTALFALPHERVIETLKQERKLLLICVYAKMGMPCVHDFCMTRVHDLRSSQAQPLEFALFAPTRKHSLVLWV